MLRELTNHVWQSTIFAVLAGLIALAFRTNRAQVRYALWLTASVKFLIPFSLLIGLGSRLEWAPVAPKTQAATAVQFTLIQMSQPFPSALPQTTSAARAAHDWATLAIFGIWACGFVVIILLRLRGWLRIRAAVRASTPINVFGAMRVRSTPGLLEPGVVGLFRPILLLPADIGERLYPAQFQAVLAHELCHARRRDNLTSAIHMIVEAVFWFHPLVWWIGARLVEERERACDEVVLRLGTKPHDYAEGILKICKSYVESPLSCVSGVTGSDLKRRIQAILTGRAARELTLAKKIGLGVAAAAAIMTPIAIGAMHVSRLQAQSQQPTPKFEEASIKPCEAFRGGNSRELFGQTFHSQCTTLERLIEQAYGLFGAGHLDPASSLMVTGGPAWIASELYEIAAQAATPQSRAMMNGPMLRALLEDRFKLKFHRETREVPVYALTVAEGGPKLQPFEGTCVPRDFDKPPSDEDCGTARGYGNRMHLKGETIADLCAGLSVLLDRHVVDKTAIAGRFDMDVDLSGEDPGMLSRPRRLPAASDPTVLAPPPVSFEAVKGAMEKLGLNLKPAEGPGEFIVIDHVERPSES